MPSLDPIIESLLVQAGFSNDTKLEEIKIDNTLVTTLVKRWRPKSYMFHLSVGECMITLKYVTLQLGLRVDEKLVTDPTYYD